MAQITSGASSDKLTVDATSKAARATLYNPDGTVLAVVDKTASSIAPGTTRGVPLLGSDYKTGRLLRAMPDGSLAGAGRTLHLLDGVEGSAVDTNKWIQTVATMSIAQATGAITFNNGSSVAGTVGAMHLSHRFFPIIPRVRLVHRWRARHTAHSNNNLIEEGFGSPSSSTAASIGTGAVWRKDGTGQYVPVISINGSETLGTAISNATWINASTGIPATEYGEFEVELSDHQVCFRAYRSDGVLVNEQCVDLTTSTPNWAVTHVQALHRTYNSAGTGAAVQLILGGSSVWTIDDEMNKPWAHAMAGMSYGPITSPTAYTQLANYSNSAAPTARTLSNTAAAETTLGGFISANAIAGAATDLIMFGWQNPSPYTFYFRGIKIPVPLNQVAAVATTETLIAYGMAFNSSAVSLATGSPYPPMRIALPGFHRAAVGLGINQIFTTGSEIAWQPQTPIAVFPGRFLHVICRVLVGTATATETYLWNIPIDGYFE